MCGLVPVAPRPSRVAGNGARLLQHFPYEVVVALIGTMSQGCWVFGVVLCVFFFDMQMLKLTRR